MVRIFGFAKYIANQFADELCKDRSTSKLDQPVFGQLACTALQVALVDLLRSWNIYPSAVVGHSSGEIAAAFCAGLITREFAWKIAYYRGIVVSRSRAFIREPETMMSVGLSESEVEPFLKRLSVDYGAQEVTVGCINSPKNVTLSGNEAQIDMLNEVLSEKGFFVRKLNVSIAYHSRSMNKVAAEYLNLIGSLPIESSSSSSAMMFSSVTGRQVFADEVKGGQYWAENLISPVRFLDAVKNLYHEYTRKRANQSNTGSAKLRIEHLLEIGPHAALRTPIRDTLVASIGGNHTTYGSMLIRGKPALETSLAAAGHIHCLGYPVRLNSINRIDQTSPEAKMLISLPEYPFDHTQYYWRESRLSKDYRFRKFPKHELLGTPVPDWNPLEARWRNIIRMSENPWVADHKVDGSVIYPAAGILLCAIQAAHLLSEQKDQITGYRIKGAIFQKALILSADLDGTETQLCLRPDRTSGSKSCIWHDFQLFTNENGQWVEICRGAVSIEYKEENVELDDGKERTEDHLCHTEIFRSGTRRCKMGLHKEILYDYLNSVGLSYGPAFQVLNDVYFNGHGEATARIDLHHWTTKVAGVNVEPHVMHPTALDGVFQLMVPALSNGGEKDMRTMVPTRVEDIWLAASGSNAKKVDIDIVRVFAQSKFEGHRDAISAIIALEEFDHKPCIIVSGFRSTAVVSRDQSLPNASATLCYNIEWKPDIELLDSHQIANLCEAATPGPFYENLAEEKELACFFYISRALNQGKSQEVLDNNPHLRRYWEWMQHTSDLFDTGTLNVSNARYEDITEQTEEWERICQSIEQKGGAEGKLIITAGKNISAILNGEINTLELLFTNNNEVLDEFYREGYGNGMGKLATYVDLLAHKNPAMKILEIGAGTGGATKRIVQALTRHGECQLGTPRFGKYCFTDISPRFFEKAAKIFNSHLDRVSFTVLNIEIDPQKQGYDIGSYDLVVAVNVSPSS